MPTLSFRAVPNDSGVADFTPGSRSGPVGERSCSARVSPGKTGATPRQNWEHFFPLGAAAPAGRTASGARDRTDGAAGEARDGAAREARDAAAGGPHRRRV